MSLGKLRDGREGYPTNILSVITLPIQITFVSSGVIFLMLRYPGLDKISPSLLSSQHHLGEEFGGEESSRLPVLGERNLTDFQTWGKGFNQTSRLTSAGLQA